MRAALFAIPTPLANKRRSIPNPENSTMGQTLSAIFRLRPWRTRGLPPMTTHAMRRPHESTVLSISPKGVFKNRKGLSQNCPRAFRKSPRGFGFHSKGFCPSRIFALCVRHIMLFGLSSLNHPPTPLSSDAIPLRTNHLRRCNQRIVNGIRRVFIRCIKGKASD